MILKRFAESIKKQDWFVVLLEVMIVVVGIFIGLQVTEWNEKRKEVIEEAILLNTIKADVEKSIKHLNVFHEKVLLERSFLKEAIIIFQEKDKSSSLSSDHCRAVWRSHIIGIMPNLGLQSVNAILSTEKINIIRSHELRNVLVSFQNESVVHHRFINFLIGDIANLVDYHAELFERKLTLKEEHLVKCDLDGIKGNPTVRNKIISNYGRKGGIIHRISLQMTSLKKMQKLLN